MSTLPDAAASYKYRRKLSRLTALFCFIKERNIMKKLIVLSLLLGAMVFTVPVAEAKTSNAAVASDPQIRVRIGRNRGNNRYGRRVRVVTQTRIVRDGRRVYRETYRITYLPNGRTRIKVISRVRIR